MKILRVCSKSTKAVLSYSPALILIGCTAIPLKRLRPVTDPPGLTCTDHDKSRLLLGEPSATFDSKMPPTFHYVVAGGGTSQYVMQANTTPAPPTYEEYRTRVLTAVQAKLPDVVKNHKVTLKLTEFLTAVSGQAQLNAAVTEKTIDLVRVSVEQRSIDQHSKAPKLSHGEMKDFADKLFDSQLRPGAATVAGMASSESGLSVAQKRLVTAHAGGDNSFVAYFTAYYKGNFVDRMGTKYSAPAVSTTIADTEITDAETVLLEFLIDAIDPTPVFGDTRIPDPTNIPAGIKFYPGGGTTAPTVFTATFAANQAIYFYIPTPPTTGSNNLCGITTGNVWVLKDLASGASDEAAAIGGLVANTVGGVSFGLGVVGKISIGDNQTLSVLVKTAASRIAMRASLAAAYWTLRNVKFNVSEP